jgi:hypothetical protein
MPSHGRARYPNLQRVPHAPAAGRGRLQRQIARCFFIHGPEVSASEIYRWARRWQRCHDGKPINQAERWSIRRILVRIADPVAHASTRGCPWIWRLRN